MEKVRIAKSLSELIIFLDEIVKKSEFKLKKIKFSDQSQWSFSDGILSHFSKGFFQVTGVKNKITSKEHLVLFQPQSALTGLAIHKGDQQIFVLLQARVEPGNTNVGQYGPTIQSTPANYLQMHGGKKTDYVELFTSYHPLVNTLGNNNQLDLGKRYFQKTKSHNYIELKELINTQEIMIWVPLQVLAEALAMDNFLNADLRSLLSVFDWDLYLRGEENNENNSNTLEENSRIFSDNKLGKNNWELTALNSLKGWEIQDNGIVDISNSGIWVDMFKISCTTREVSEWSQPLLCCSNRGMVILLIRKINGHYYFLVSIQSEFGITGEISVLPSYVVYPGENNENKNNFSVNGNLITEMIQSEEGGRFYKNENIYKVIQIKDEIEKDADQYWVNLYTLKSILKSSNRASFQLRCVASLVMDKLNSQTFAMQNMNSKKKEIWL